ncbi:MAG TPA: PilZ domain-containing protein [Bradyrhizobium sp.]|uniref:PilZ domain-containing protein n=1 Tax=Bradyrhizobium sp. TaxID=376 RepID=UPI002D7EDDC5|nr:PilZ domain-containing protein [Bradyrhizobium sp.]HET7886642.1 PilZ domain-containing protein [Bradyrhizobium sp.]
MPEDERRVIFEKSIAVQIMAIDGTWARPCTLKEISDNGATLVIETSVQGLNLKEFFLLLSSTGLAYRRCELDWMNGDQMGVNFLHQRGKPKKPSPGHV